MNKKDWQKLGVSMMVGALMILVTLSVINFKKTKEEMDITIKNPITEENFQNESDMEEQEIRLLVEQQRQILKNFFQEAQYYTLSEVADYNKEEDENYIVVDEEFLQELKKLFTLELYTKYWEEFTEINPKATIDLKSRVYMARKDLFDDVYTKSAIATLSVNEETLVLKNASNEKIETLVNIKLCEETEETCQRNEFYTFFLIKEDELWKISEFTNRY